MILRLLFLTEYTNVADRWTHAWRHGRTCIARQQRFNSTQLEIAVKL